MEGVDITFISAIDSLKIGYDTFYNRISPTCLNAKILSNVRAKQQLGFRTWKIVDNFTTFDLSQSSR